VSFSIDLTLTFYDRLPLMGCGVAAVGEAQESLAGHLPAARQGCVPTTGFVIIDHTPSQMKSGYRENF
jgi:hypothetical protein